MYCRHRFYYPSLLAEKYKTTKILLTASQSPLFLPNQGDNKLQNKNTRRFNWLLSVGEEVDYTMGTDVHYQFSTQKNFILRFFFLLFLRNHIKKNNFRFLIILTENNDF